MTTENEFVDNSGLSAEEVTEVKVTNQQLSRDILDIVDRLYGDRVKSDTILSEVDTDRKKAVQSGWTVAYTRHNYVYRFSNPHFMDIYIRQYGLRPQIIRARNTSFLKFKKPKERKSPYRKIPGNIAFEKDGYVYAKAVRHPGVKARKFIDKILYDQKLWDKFYKEVEQRYIQLVDEQTRKAQAEIEKILK